MFVPAGRQHPNYGDFDMSYDKRTPAALRPIRAPKINGAISTVRARLHVSAELAAALDVPLLKTEDPAAFKKLLDAIVNAFQPCDGMDYILVRDIADDTWDINRYK